jgi:membrane-bound lytic murein transglycosylase D
LGGSVVFSGKRSVRERSMHQDGTRSAWLVRTSGPLAGARRLIRGDVTRVGRGPDNDVVIDETTTVSGHHFEIRKENGSYKISDLNSTNGTFVNGERIVEATLAPSSCIQIGAAGPEFRFVLDDTPPDGDAVADASATLIDEPAPIVSKLERAGAWMSREQEALLASAIARARVARRRGIGDQTLQIMRNVLQVALRRTRRKFKATVGALALALIGVTGYGIWKIASLREEQRNIDTQIAKIEELLEKAGLTDSETDELADRLDRYEDQARALQGTLLYRVSVRQPEDPVERGIRNLMAEFGTDTYKAPPEFVDQVKRFIQRYQGADRPHMLAALGESRKDVSTMRNILEQCHLPADLAYMALVESAVSNANKSSAGAAGVWQFTPATAKAYGLTLNAVVDERLDIRKSTQAACKLLRDLILDFGAESSVMLALAAYNSGTARVKQGIRRVSDPIKQRNFWYLYRVRALPVETREYVPKVFAAMIIARDPHEFGF